MRSSDDKPDGTTFRSETASVSGVTQAAAPATAVPVAAAGGAGTSAAAGGVEADASKAKRKPRRLSAFSLDDRKAPSKAVEGAATTASITTIGAGAGAGAGAGSIALGAPSPRKEYSSLVTSPYDDRENFTSFQVMFSKTRIRIEVQGAGVSHIHHYLWGHFINPSKLDDPVRKNFIDPSIVKAYQVKDWARVWYTTSTVLRFDFGFPSDALTFFDALKLAAGFFILQPRTDDVNPIHLDFLETGYLIITPSKFTEQNLFSAEDVWLAFLRFLSAIDNLYKARGITPCDEFYPVDISSLHDRAALPIVSMFAPIGKSTATKAEMSTTAAVTEAEPAKPLRPKG